jgi:hypothetical protein
MDHHIVWLVFPGSPFGKVLPNCLLSLQTHAIMLPRIPSHTQHTKLDPRAGSVGWILSSTCKKSHFKKNLKFGFMTHNFLFYLFSFP